MKNTIKQKLDLKLKTEVNAREKKSLVLENK
jgi:hypothetical protein